MTKIVGYRESWLRHVFLPVAHSFWGAGIVLCRKPGKLPCETIQESYQKEYGVDTIEIHKDAINENDVVLLHDDLLATGGTMKAAVTLLRSSILKRCIVTSLSNSIRNFLTVVTSSIRILKLLLYSNSNQQDCDKNLPPYPFHMGKRK